MYVVQEGYLKTAVMPIEKKERLRAILLSCKHPHTINSSKHICKHLRSDTRFRGCAHTAFDLLPTVRARWSSALSLGWEIHSEFRGIPRFFQFRTFWTPEFSSEFYFSDRKMCSRQFTTSQKRKAAHLGV